MAVLDLEPIKATQALDLEPINNGSTPSLDLESMGKGLDLEPINPSGNIFSDMFKGIARGIERIPTGPAKLLTMGGEELKYQATKVSPEQPKTTDRKLSPIKQHLYNIGSSMSDWGKNASTFYEKLASTGKEAPNPAVMLGWKHPFRKVAALAAENLPMLGVAAGVTAATAGAGAGPALAGLTGASTFGPQAAGDFYEEATKAGIPHSKARDMALLSASAQVGLENIALGQWMKGGALVKRMARTAIAEGPVEEGTQQLFDNALKVIGWKGTSNLWEDMTDGLAESIAAGAVSGAVLGSFNPPSFVDIKSDIEADIRREAKKTGASPEATDKVVKLVSTMMDERAKSISDNALDMTPKNIDIIKEELEKSIGVVIPKDIKTYEIKAGEGLDLEPMPTPLKAEKSPVIEDLKGETGIVAPTAKGGEIDYEPIVKEAIDNTAGAKITPEGIELDISRYQKESQFGAQAIRTGVFYLPETKSPYGKYYSTGKQGYGGGKKVSGRTTYHNPIIVKAGTGGKGVEKAYDQVVGKGAYQKMRSDILDRVVSGFNKNENQQVVDLQAVLEEYTKIDSVEAYDMAEMIVRNSKEGNQLAYAIQENIAANTIREAGYDAVISHSISGGKPRLAEVFDLRATEYPSETSDYKYNDFYSKLSPKETAKGGEIEVYHGTNVKFKDFAPRKGVRFNTVGGQGEVDVSVSFFTPNKKIAKGYAIDRVKAKGGKENIIKAYLDIKNPIDLSGTMPEIEAKLLPLGIDLKEIFGESPFTDGVAIRPNEVWKIFDDKEIVNKLKSEGFDSAILDETNEDLKIKQGITYAVFDPKNIKLSPKETAKGGEIAPKVVDGKIKDFNTFLKWRVPEIKDIKGNFITTKDGNRIEFISHTSGEDVVISHILADTKGTGIGSKIVKAAQDFADVNMGQLIVKKPYNEPFWKKMGVDVGDGNRGINRNIDMQNRKDILSKLSPKEGGDVTLLGLNAKTAQAQQAKARDNIKAANEYKFIANEGDKITIDKNGEKKPYIIESRYMENGEPRYNVYPPGKKNSNAHKIWIRESDILSTPKEAIPQNKISKLERESQTGLDAQSLIQYNKKFNDLKMVEQRKILQGEGLRAFNPASVLPEDTVLKIAKKKDVTNEWENKLVMAARKNGEYATDGRVLIIDKKVANQLRDKFLASKGLPDIDIGKSPLPPYKDVIPKNQGEPLNYIGTTPFVDRENPIMVYETSKGERIAIDSGYFRMFKEYFPTAKLKYGGERQGVQVYVGKELKGIIMPKDIGAMLDKELGNPNITKPSTPSGNAMATPFWHNDIPIEQGTEYYKLRSFETPELVRLVREVMGKYPDVVKATGKAAGRFYGAYGNPRIKIVAELFKQGNEKELGIVIAHEFGHLTDYMPEGTLKRGNILGRLLTLRSYLTNTFGNLNNKEIRTELVAVTKYMHPFDEKTVPPAYKSYRLSSKELYAEAISLLLNSPGTMEKMAPKFTKTFFENLDKKMDIKEAYFDLLELLNGERSDVLDALDEDIRRMFAKADPLRTQKLAEKKVATVSTFDKIRLHLDNKYHMLIKKIQNLEKTGQFVPIENNPKYLLEEYAMSNNAVYDWLLTMDKVVKNPLAASDVDIIDFGKYLFLKRIIGSPQLQGEDVDAFDDDDKDALGEMIDASTGKPFKEEFTDRKNIANPLGIQPARAQEQLNYLKSKIGDEKFAKIEEFAKKFHDLVFKVVTEAVKVGSYNAKVFAERIEPNKDTYVSFGVINYLQNFVSAGVKKQIGTLNEIENPFLTTVMKTVSLIKLNEKQRTMNSVRNFLRQYFPSEIQVSKKHKTTGGGVDWTETPGSFKLLEDGRMVSYEIDPYIARSLKYDPNAGEIGQLLNTILGNKIFKDIVITYNPGFALAFNPIRDFKRTYKSLNAMNGKVSLFRLLTEYVKAMPSSYRRLQGIDDNTIREMIQNRALDIPFNDFHAADYQDSDGAYNELLKKYQLSKNPDELRGIRKTLLKPIVQVLEFLRFHGSALESVSKIAGYNILKSRDIAPMERAFRTRTYIGTPNFKTKGLSTETTNAIFIFSNIMKEGLKADVTLATNPKTRGGYWWATAKIDLLPKLLMVLAAAGLFGEGLKRLFDKASEYDKTNYIIIPLGEMNGKAVYIRIPHDETGRLISSIFWKVAGALQGKPDQLQQIFAFGAGQMPQLTPALAIGTGWIQYLSGQNPYEPFRGGNVLTDTEYKAGGGSALKKMVEWTANEFGLTSFFTYTKDSKSTFESIIQLTPVINRLLRVSDSGVSQDLRQIRKSIEQEQAQITLLKRGEFKKGAERFNKGDEPLRILYDISKKVYPNEEKIDKRKFSILQKGLIREILKKREDSPYVDAMLYAGSNEEKKQILFKMKDRLPFNAFIKQAMLMKDLKIYSNEVMDSNEWRDLLKQK